ncbi:MAG TPA: STAS domain-containing protein [Pseudomonadales bacterium]|nr:STAS domain-containing protein [Pseudomonadales bacterium]
MLEIERLDDGDIKLIGRLDAAQADAAQKYLDGVDGPCTLDLADLEYISSAGLGVLLKTHKRLMSQSSALRLVHVSSHLADIFKFSGFDKLFQIETS